MHNDWRYGFSLALVLPIIHSFISLFILSEGAIGAAELSLRLTMVVMEATHTVHFRHSLE